MEFADLAALEHTRYSPAAAEPEGMETGRNVNERTAEASAFRNSLGYSEYENYNDEKKGTLRKGWRLTALRVASKYHDCEPKGKPGLFPDQKKFNEKFNKRPMSATLSFGTGTFLELGGKASGVALA